MLKKITVGLIAVIASADSAEAIKMKAQQRAKIDQAVENYVNAESGSKAEWGFLKNIVNIDRFFDSGVKA